MQFDPKKMIEPMTQAMACMHNTQKDSRKKLTSTKSTGSKPYLGKSKPPEITKGLDDTTDPNLTCTTARILGMNLLIVESYSENTKRTASSRKYNCGKSVIQLNKKHP